MFCVRAASVVAQHVNQCLINIKPLDMNTLNILTSFQSNKEIMDAFFAFFYPCVQKSVKHIHLYTQKDVQCVESKMNKKLLLLSPHPHLNP